MASLITYDIKETEPDLHEAVRIAMLKDDYIRAEYYNPLGRARIILPNTTFYSQRYNKKMMVDKLANICKLLGATLERCIAVDIEGNPFGIEGIAF